MLIKYPYHWFFLQFCASTILTDIDMSIYHHPVKITRGREMVHLVEDWPPRHEGWSFYPQHSYRNQAWQHTIVTSVLENGDRWISRTSASLTEFINSGLLKGPVSKTEAERLKRVSISDSICICTHMNMYTHKHTYACTHTHTHRVAPIQISFMQAINICSPPTPIVFQYLSLLHSYLHLLFINLKMATGYIALFATFLILMIPAFFHLWFCKSLLISLICPKTVFF